MSEVQEKKGACAGNQAETNVVSVTVTVFCLFVCFSSFVCCIFAVAFYIILILQSRVSNGLATER